MAHTNVRIWTETYAELAAIEGATQMPQRNVLHAIASVFQAFDADRQDDAILRVGRPDDSGAQGRQVWPPTRDLFDEICAAHGMKDPAAVAACCEAWKLASAEERRAAKAKSTEAAPPDGRRRRGAAANAA